MPHPGLPADSGDCRREDWIRRGMPWLSIGEARRVNWNPELQLKELLEQ